VAALPVDEPEDDYDEEDEDEEDDDEDDDEEDDEEPVWVWYVEPSREGPAGPPGEPVPGHTWLTPDAAWRSLDFRSRRP
jgi:hypothetical protein